jgi:hypothetical protein
LKKSEFHLSEELADFDMFSLPTGPRETGIVLLCYTSGLITLREINGKDIGNFTTPGPVRVCSGLVTTEEIYIAVATDSALILQSLKQEKSLRIVSQTSVQLTSQAVAVKVAARGMKRLWIVADTAGSLSAYHFNGTFLRSTDLSIGGLIGLEKSGYSFISAGTRNVVIANPASGEVLLQCDQVTQLSRP